VDVLEKKEKDEGIVLILIFGLARFSPGNDAMA